MELTDRFFGRGTPQFGEPPVANPWLESPPSFALLYPDVPDLDADALTLALRNYHPELASATAEVVKVPQQAADAPGSSPAFMGLIGWDRHVVKVVGFRTPMPAATVEQCVLPAHYDPVMKDEAYRHASHIRLFYAGYEPDPFEQHVALAAAAAALARFGAIVALNETASTSIPAPALLPHEEDNGDTLAAIRSLPLPFLFAGFVKIEVDGEPGVWMRTYGCHAFKLPDLAFHADGHHQGSATFNLFSNMLLYLRSSGKSFEPGDTTNVGEGLFLRFRDRTEQEWFLKSEGQMLVLERIAAEEVNG